MWGGKSSAAIGTRTKRYHANVEILMAISLADSPATFARPIGVRLLNPRAANGIYPLAPRDDDWRFLADPAERWAGVWGLHQI